MRNVGDSQSAIDSIKFFTELLVDPYYEPVLWFMILQMFKLLFGLCHIAGNHITFQ